MIPSGAEVKRKRKRLYLLDCRPEGACEVKFARCDHLLVFQTETSLSSPGSKEESGCWVEASVCRWKKVMQLFSYAEKNDIFYIILKWLVIFCVLYTNTDIPERSKHCSVFYQLACILNLWNCIFSCSYSIYDLFFSQYKSVPVLRIHGRYSILFFNMLCLEQISSQSWAYKILIICVWRYVAIAIPLVWGKISI